MKTMTWLNRIVAGCRALFTRGRDERDLDVELRHFMDARIDEKVRTGMSRWEAARAARLEMGSLDLVKDRVRDAGWDSLIESAGRDIRYALRTLRKAPAFAAVAISTLALGIGATTAVFSLLDAVILKSLPVTNPEQLVLVGGGGLYPAFQAYRRHTEIFTDVCATSGVMPLDVEVQSGVRERTDVSLVSGSYFSVLGVQAAIGRTLTSDDDQVPGAGPVAVASDGYWQRRFGRDAAIVGTVVRVSGMPITIVGVAPAGFFGEQVGAAPDLWMPLMMWGHVVPGPNHLQNPGTGWLRIIGRVQPGVATSGPQPALTQTFRQVVSDIYGPAAPADVRRDIARSTVTLQSANKGLSSLRAQFARPLALLMGAVVLVLLIACANIANLLLSRAAARRREIDVRLALGMSRARLVRQLVTESLVLAFLGGALGVLLAWLGREALLRLISADGARVPVAVAIDARLLAFVALISSATAILFGLVPAWHSTRAALGRSLATRSDAGGHPRRRLRAVLVVAQVALSLVLLMGAGLFLRTIANLREVDLGFAPDHLLVIGVNPPSAGYTGERAVALGRRLLETVQATPGVASVSVSEHGMLTGTDNGTNLMRPRGLVEGPDGFPQTRWDVVGPRYFSTVGTALLSGRDFTDRDAVTSPLVIAINEEMARRFFGRANPIGQHMRWGADKDLEIVAVTRGVKQRGPREEPPLRFYLPYLQMPVIRPGWILTNTRLLVRTSATPASLAPALRQAIASVEPRLPVTSLDVGPDLVSRTLVQERMVATLLVAFGVLAVGLACLGLYGLIAYHVVQRTSEIGIRMALGAQRGDVLWATLRQAMVWIVAGVALGTPLALSASRLAQNLLFGLTATDAPTLIGAVIVMSAMGLLAGYIPARRASRVDPVIALRAD